jgi:hypothetical protein
MDITSTPDKSATTAAPYTRDPLLYCEQLVILARITLKVLHEFFLNYSEGRKYAISSIKTPLPGITRLQRHVFHTCWRRPNSRWILQRAATETRWGLFIRFHIPTPLLLSLVSIPSSEPTISAVGTSSVLQSKAQGSSIRWSGGKVH